MEIYIYIYIYVYTYTHICVSSALSNLAFVAANLGTKIMDFRGFDSSVILILRGGIPRSIASFPEGLSQAILVGMMLVGRLGEAAERLLRAGDTGICEKSTPLEKKTFGCITRLCFQHLCLPFCPVPYLTWPTNNMW